MKNKPATSVQRYSEIPLPGIRYLPGTSTPDDKEQIQSWLDSLPDDAPLSSASWRGSTHYLYAVDLFNNQYWWEAHEVLEGIWVNTGRQGALALFLQGLIQISACLLKESQSQHKGAKRLLRRALPKLSSQTGVYLGIDVGTLTSSIEAFITGNPSHQPLIVLVDF